MTRHRHRPQRTYSIRWLWLICALAVLVLLGFDALVVRAAWHHGGTLGMIYEVVGQALVALVVVLISVWDESRRHG